MSSYKNSKTLIKANDDFFHFYQRQKLQTPLIAQMYICKLWLDNNEFCDEESFCFNYKEYLSGKKSKIMKGKNKNEVKKIEELV